MLLVQKMDRLFSIPVALLLLLLVPSVLVEAFAPASRYGRGRTTTTTNEAAGSRTITAPGRSSVTQTTWNMRISPPRNLESSSLSSAASFRLGSSRSDETSSEAAAETSKKDDQSKKPDQPVLKAFLTDEYSAFAQLLSLNPGIWEMLDKESAVTIFCPPNAAFDRLGEKRLRQLRDVRNEETAQKIGQYHVVLGDAVSAARLRTEDWTVKLPPSSTSSSTSSRPIKVSGLITMGGEVPVGRPKQQPSKSSEPNLLDRMLGAVLQPAENEQTSTGSKNDVCIGPAGRLQKTYKLANGKYYVHEVDGFISPDILWRYCDQLRIPGF
jgi:uncharacterized surface protein with fasciclin (FAS1) repeats